MNTVTWNIFKDETHLWRYSLRASNGQILFISHNNYASEKDVNNAITAAYNLILMAKNASIVKVPPPKP